MTMMDARQVALSISNGLTQENFLPVGGLTATEAEWTRRPPRAGSLSDGPWERALEEAGPRALTLRGQGVFEASAGEALLLTAVQTGRATRFRLTFGTTQTVQGAFHITRYRRRMDRDGLVEAELTLESSGEVTLA
jgi:predicted secreted protein